MSGGANTALYVVDDPTSLSAAETAVQGRLTAAGLTVTLIDNFDPAPSDVDTYSIVVVAKGNGANLAGSGGGPGKYALTTAPILWMHASGSGAESAIYDHYLVSATTSANSSAGNGDTVNTVHQSTGNLSTGAHTFSTLGPGSGGTKQYEWTSTMLAAAVVRLTGGNPVAWTFESCDALRVGTAPNRRMVLSWFGPMLSFPTADSTTALDGAIAWCLAGVPCPRSGLRVRGFLVYS